MKLLFREENYENYGKCIVLSNGTVEIYVSLDIGPRVLRYGFIGGENVFFNDLKREVVNNDLSINKTFGQPGWNIYGGHRLWTSPEYMPETYYPDCYPVEFIKTEQGGIFNQVEQLPFKKKCSIEFVLGEDTNITVIHRVTNTGTTQSEYAIWALSVLAPGGTEIIPMPRRKTGYLANRVISVWDYVDMSDDRVYWGKDYITLKQDPAAESSFKFGINNDVAVSGYFNKGLCFIKHYDHHENGVYPDYGVSYETYTNAKFLEAETLGELKKVAPGETISHNEYWSLVKTDISFDHKNEAETAKAAAIFLQK